MSELSHNLLLRDLAVVMMAAAMVTVIFHRLRLPVVLGYILAGFIVGPHTFPLIENEQSIRTLADLGVVFLLFSLGLQFRLRTLVEVGSTALVASALEILLMLWAGYQLGRLFGWNQMDSIFLGAMLSITSTTLIVKTLTELNLLKQRFAQFIFGIQIVEDTLGMTMIALLSGLALTGTVEWGRLAGALGRVAVFVVLVLIVGLIVVPRLLRHIARYKSDEMLLVAVLGLCFGVTLAAVKLGHSIALGAFLIGTIIGEARESGKIKFLTEPVRDMFSAVFFVTIGLQINPFLLRQYAVPILVISTVVVAGKIVAFSSGTFLTGHDLRTSLRVGTCMVPIGELSFIIAALGVSLGVTSDFLYSVAVSVSAITMPLSPYLSRHAAEIAEWLEQRLPRSGMEVLAAYTQWTERLQLSRRDSPARRLARRWLWQIGLNVLFATGVLLLMPAAGWLSERWSWLRDIPPWLGGGKGLLWLVAVLVAMPALIAAVRKLEALAMLLAEISASLGGMGGRSAAAVQFLVSRVILWAGTVGLGVWVLVISAAFLPPWPGVLVLLALIGLLGVLLWRFFIQIHAKAQVALRETLAQTTSAEAEAEAGNRTDRVLPSILQAQIESVTIASGSPVAGKLIRELALRSHSGASIVAIERNGEQIINPGADEELRAGDTLLLLGSSKQLAKARALLAS